MTVDVVWNSGIHQKFERVCQIKEGLSKFSLYELLDDGKTIRENWVEMNDVKKLTVTF